MWCHRALLELRSPRSRFLANFLYNSLAFCLEVFDWNWEAADREFWRAIELNPDYATAHHWYAWHVILLGRNSEGVSKISNVLP